MKFIRPIVGEWYQDSAREFFEVVAIDEADKTIEIQFVDGRVAETDFDWWSQRLRDDHLEAAVAPEDWSASESEASDFDPAVEDMLRPSWGDTDERAARR